jgi:hypothetical protein
LISNSIVNRFRISNTLARRLDDRGLSPSTVLRCAGLPIGLFSQDKILLTTEEFFALYRGIAEVSPARLRRIAASSVMEPDHSAPGAMPSFTAENGAWQVVTIGV